VSWDRKRRGPASGYFYKSVRTPDGVKKQYLGRGAVGQQAAAEVEHTKLARRLDREAVRAEADALAEADRLAAELAGWAEALVTVWMVAAGHHRRRGQWRRRHRDG
jgi:hypothetical protein